MTRSEPQGSVHNFQQACESLESAWNSLYEDLITVSRGAIHGKLLYRAMAGVKDIVHSGSLLLDAHREATAASLAQTSTILPQLMRLFAGELSVADFQATTAASAAVTGKLSAAYKAFFYVVRAYHDTVYRMILNILGLDWWGKGASMQKAHDEKNPVGVLLRDRLANYLPWFTGWREKRNLVKDGVTTGWAGPDTDLGLVFNEVVVTPTTYAVRTDVSTAIRLSDAANAMTMSGRITALVHELIKQRRR